MSLVPRLLAALLAAALSLPALALTQKETDDFVKVVDERQRNNGDWAAICYMESKGTDVWYPEEMRFYDEVEKANSTLILVRQVDLRSLTANMFTKAWLEAKSR